MHLQVENLTLRRGERTLISSLSFELAAGEALVLKGPNGVGKTTLIRAIAGFIRPAGGEVRLAGGLTEHSVAEQCHFIGHQNAVKSGLTVRENADFWRLFQAIPAAAAKGATAGLSRVAGNQTDVALERLGLAAIAGIRAGYLSAGQRRRLALTRLLLSPRPVWLLDEPTVSLDADATRVLADLIAEHRGGGGLALAATHIDLGLAQARELRLERASQELEAAWDHS